MSETITIRLSKTKVADIHRHGDIRHYLGVEGMDTRTMRCREEGEELVYEGERLVKADGGDME